MFSEQQLKVIEYCAEEVKRQGDGPTNVFDMVNAWAYAQERYNRRPNDYQPMDLDFIEQAGKLVEPTENAKGFRTIPIGVGNSVEWIEKAKPDNIQRLLGILIEAYYAGNLDPQSLRDMYKNNENWSKYKFYKKAETAEDIFYFEFEEIHPFRDGNGRTGKVLYNYLKGTLDNPVWPPNFWGVSNP